MLLKKKKKNLKHQFISQREANEILRLDPVKCKYEKAGKMFQIFKWNRKKYDSYKEGGSRNAPY